MIVILIIEDEAVVAENIKEILEEENYHVCGIAYNCFQAMKLFNTHKPNILFCDIRLKQECGLDFIDDILHRHCTVIIFVTSYSDKETIEKISKYTNAIFITKPFTKEQILSSIRIAVTKFQKNHHNIEVTKRERALLQLIHDGKTNKEIAELLYISLDTVKTHKKNLYEKFGVHCIEDLINKTIIYKQKY